MLVDTEPAIMLAMDEPSYVHHALESILRKMIRAAELWKGTPADMVETGGGAGSNTVISPQMFEEFCLPYDQRQHAVFREAGVKIVYHLCGGVMHMLDMVAKNGAHGLETMTPPTMGGDCDLREASRSRRGSAVFHRRLRPECRIREGSPETARRLVFDCFEATKDHAGYIIAPSDHFFSGAPENIQAFADAARECRY